MNILVTGAAGFIGSRLAEHLGNDHTVYGLIHDLQRWPNKWEPIRGDITDYPRMLDIIVSHEIEYIYHLAAKSIVRNCKSDPLGCLQGNVMGTANILEAARHSDNIKGVMCAESDKAYGAGPVPYREDQALQPGGIYEASKACVSHLARTYYCNYGLPVFTVRSANVYGPGDRNMTRLIPNTISRLLRGETPQITAGAESFMREFYYVDDFVRTGCELMAARPWGEAINVGSGDMISVREMVNVVCSFMDEQQAVMEWSKPAGLLEIPTQSLCLDKLDKWLPEREVTSLQTGLERTIEWHRDLSRST